MVLRSAGKPDLAKECSAASRDVCVHDRRTGELVQERVLGDRLLRLAYFSPLRPLCQLTLFRYSLASRVLGWYCDSAWSRRKIAGVIEFLGIDTAEFREPLSSFRTFNEFFCRRLREGARPFDPDPAVLCSPADARLTVIPRLEDEAQISVKGGSFTVEALLRAPAASDVAGLAGGAAVIARLCPADYHRFHYPAAGSRDAGWEIGGRYNSVNPLALAARPAVFQENRRFVSILDLHRFGKTAFVEVGAFGVGGIVQTHTAPTFEKMDEKGYFRFGASTIVLLFQPDAVRIDADLLANSEAGRETLVRAGETIGRCPA